MLFAILRFVGLAALGIVVVTNDTSKVQQVADKAVEISARGSDFAAPAIAKGGGGSACDGTAHCDRTTGCVAPTRPEGPVVTVLPKTAEYDRYVFNLEVFQACRKLVLLSLRNSRPGVRLASLNPMVLEESAFADAVLRWNGNIFWEPASESSNLITRFGDEARAVFGPIPAADCSDGAAKTIPLEVDGDIVNVMPNPLKPDHPLEFEHRDLAGNVVAWTTTIPKCDKPSLAGNVSYCGLNSRLNRVIRGNVEWLTLCRKSENSLEVGDDPYWQASNTKFALLGTIGFNQASGEIVFFDGTKRIPEFDWSEPFVPPGGRSYADTNGRMAAERLYDPTFQIECYACHDNKNAYVVDPHAEQARIGYFGGEHDPRAAAFSLGSYLPSPHRFAGAPFRVIGTGYTATYRDELARARTVNDPTGNCTGCHPLTTQVTGRRFAADAVAELPFVSHATWAQIVELRAEEMKYAAIGRHRTDWALRSGIHPWMAPNVGNDLSQSLTRMDVLDWQKLSNCLWGAGGTECGYQPLYTPCPAPESGSLGDSSQPADVAISVLPLPADEIGTGRMIRVKWNYLNRYGSVPERDDVRFNIAVKEVRIPLGDRASDAADYPSMDEAQGNAFKAINGDVGISGLSLLIGNASYAGHLRWRDATATTEPRAYKIDFPGKCNRRYLVRILPKRFCFDQSNVTYGSADHLLYADVLCD